MAMYRTCPLCGAHLDPGETRDCKEKKEEKEEMDDGSKSNDSN